MKKVITILAVLTLVVGLAFATNPSETHTLHIKSVVNTVRPAFQLVLSTTSTNSSSAAFYNNKVGTNYTSPTGENAAVDVGFSISDGGSVTFSAVLKNATNTKEAFKLSFSGGEFGSVTRYGVPAPRGPQSITTEIATVIDATNEDKGIASIAYDSSVASTETNKPIIITFDGQLDTSVFNVTDGVVIATAEYVYPEDKTIDAGTYYADVMLTVTTN